jgi:hypothetical protein
MALPPDFELPVKPVMKPERRKSRSITSRSRSPFPLISPPLAPGMVVSAPWWGSGEDGEMRARDPGRCMTRSASARLLTHRTVPTPTPTQARRRAPGLSSAPAQRARSARPFIEVDARV